MPIRLGAYHYNYHTPVVSSYLSCR